MLFRAFVQGTNLTSRYLCALGSFMEWGILAICYVVLLLLN